MIELTASPRSSCSLIIQHRVSSTGHQGHRWLGGAAAVIVIRIVSETQLSGQRSVAHYTLYSTLLTILGQCWEDGKISAVPYSICDDNISQVSSLRRGEGGEKCNKILLKNNIYSDQGPVPDVGITLPRGGHQANIFSFK